MNATQRTGLRRVIAEVLTQTGTYDTLARATELQNQLALRLDLFTLINEGGGLLLELDQIPTTDRGLQALMAALSATQES